MNKKGIIGLVLAVCLLLTFVSPALAGGLTVSNAKIETSVNPGDDFSYSMNVKNTSDEPMDIMVEIKGYGMSADRDFIMLEPEEDKSPYTARELLAVSPADFHLEPGDSQAIDISAKIPPGTGEGGRYAIVLIHTVAKEGGMISTITAIAARVLFTISGFNVNTDSEITQVSIAKTVSPEPAGLLVTVANNGNYHYKPQVQAKLKDGDKVVATTSVAPGWPIIPGYSRQFKLNFADQELLSAADYKVDVEVKDEKGNLLAGGTYLFESAKNQGVLLPAKPSVPSPSVPSSPSENIPSPTKESTTAPPLPPTPPAPAPSLISWPVIGGVIAVVVIGLLIFFLVKRRSYY